MAKKSHYPSFDVMKERDEWDSHTQIIVTERLREETTWQALQELELATLGAVCRLLVADERDNVIPYILMHFDQIITSKIGEGQRKAGVPEEKTLIREGLQQLDNKARNEHGAPFDQLEGARQSEILERLSEGKLQLSPEWTALKQKGLFKKLLGTAIDAYCSHPDIWSEIGYAGPAYPRGYVRGDIGQLDPWEAKTEA
ncbi:gluconate 2-dehydrogenase subunit 3 family protein [Paenibacillus apiarius]|uniref:Gluconate 2-dehydrogenase subunit 3 family protein n=1 Tax=Paenibacillus apiarius TaxID=46240 RepID=A0ABT4DT89_9BACL|nr:gluconate 2-dehydrogenase subunit 3 family protein [Paenibacillus apiarius]MCY9515016.1 gluconate 2-dehydrogenase subunit 3 family protein [Paenibacillus apiarius]MCY9520566.1 gluconate 2-dehydrogenase subunit 3 family protein [Paenibacillus apiarius]MCY9552128.1 gluconate 2-dehydrogenase subunit 3 family protein [Paenibacillus apiarius]MCY9561086.1 gluconate 2-dehydrogenase subunit 3 family protein [Paenibacillus apiarius]MCY9686273.1 gluconate 2-dehydrogenase subunit 3 family protein [Pae